MPDPNVVTEQPEIIIRRQPNGDWDAITRLPSPEGPVEFTAKGFDKPQDAWDWVEGYLDAEA